MPEETEEIVRQDDETITSLGCPEVMRHILVDREIIFDLFDAVLRIGSSTVHVIYGLGWQSHISNKATVAVFPQLSHFREQFQLLRAFASYI